MPAPLVVGLDSAANRWHMVANRLISRGRGHQRFHTMQSGPLEGKDWKDADARRQRLLEDAVSAFEWLPEGTHIFCEEPIAGKNGKTTRLLGLAAGVLWAAANIPVLWPSGETKPRDLWWHWVDIAHWKKIVVGNGNADKDMIALHVQMQGRSYEEQDHYDADCLCQFGEQWLQQHAEEAA